MFKRLFALKKLKLYVLAGGIGLYFNRDKILLKLGDKYLKNYTPQPIQQKDKTVSEVLSDYFSKIAIIPLLIDDKKESEAPQEDILEIKEYQRNSILKVQSYYDKAYSYDEKLKQLIKSKEGLKKSLIKEQSNEEKTIKEILQLKEKTLAKAQELNDKSLQLNTERLDMINLINKKQNDYINVNEKLSKEVNTCFEEGLK